MPVSLCHLGKIATACLLLALATVAQGQALPWRLLDGTGKPVTFEAMLADVARADVVFYGELHNHSLAHWQQLQLLEGLHRQRPQLALGLEMFEADVQPVLDEYMAGLIKARNFEQESRPWPNYTADYKPLLDFCKKNRLPVIATNVPRRYAAAVAERGITVLPQLMPTAQAWLPEQPLSLDTSATSIYTEMRTMMGGHGGLNMLQAQALKDAVMAQRIARSLKPGSTLLHLNGAFHSKNRQGIISYLNQLKPGLKIKTIQCVEVPGDVQKATAPKGEQADYFLILSDTAPKSH